MNAGTIHKAALFALCLVVAGDAVSDIYRWTDENGKAHYSDRNPGDQKTESIEVKVNTYKSVSYDTSIFDTGQKVVMYSTSWCVYCKQARNYFEENGISYSDYDIEKDVDARARLT